MLKQNLGQFYTTRQEYILTDIFIPDDVIIIEPFVGNGDLLRALTTQKTELYDIDPKIQGVVNRDTLLNPPEYKGKFILTNPPYLASNKNTLETNERVYKKYKCDDLYKCFIKSILDSGAIGGVIIIPINFFCSNRKADINLRKQFMMEYKINKVNLFEDRVFDDTTYCVCAVSFVKGNSKTIPFVIFPKRKELSITLVDYCVAGELLKLPIDRTIKISRATKLNYNSPFITNINLKCIDDNKIIGLEYVLSENRYIDTTSKLSARSYACLVISKNGGILTEKEQKKLVFQFNQFLDKKRKEYHSLFLTNYREYSRKRISFEFAFKLCNYLLSNT